MEEEKEETKDNSVKKRVRRRAVTATTSTRSKSGTRKRRKTADAAQKETTIATAAIASPGLKRSEAAISEIAPGIKFLPYSKVLEDQTYLVPSQMYADIVASRSFSSTWWPEDGEWKTHTDYPDNPRDPTPINFISPGLILDPSILCGVFSDVGYVPSQLSIVLAGKYSVEGEEELLQTCELSLNTTRGDSPTIAEHIYYNTGGGPTSGAETSAFFNFRSSYSLRFNDFRHVDYKDGSPLDASIRTFLRIAGFAYVPENHKAFLCGNSYAKLSGLFITSLDFKKAVEEWASLPYLQTMYGAPLLGFAMEPGATERSATFVPRDGTLPASDGTWYPVYEQKTHYIDSKDSFTEAISALAPDLKWLSGETIRLDLKVEDRDLSASESLSIKLANDGRTISFVENGPEESIHISDGAFHISALLNGSDAVSDWIDVDSVDSTEKVAGIAILPKDRLTDEQIRFRELFAEQHGFRHRDGETGQESSMPEYIDFICGLSNELDVSVPTITDKPWKSPYLLKRDELGLIQYYRNLGIDLPNDYIKQFDSMHAIYTDLTSKYPDVPILDGFAERYETTITPSRSGWIKFYIASDDQTVIAIDDKIVAFAMHGEQNNLSSLSTWMNNIIDRGDRCPYDKEQARKLSTQVYLSPTKNVSLSTYMHWLSAATIASISSDILDRGDLNAFGYNTIVNDTDQRYILSDSWVADTRIHSPNYKENERNLIFETSYYSQGAYIYLVKGHSYKFQAIHIDRTQLSSILDGRAEMTHDRAKSRVLTIYHSDVRTNEEFDLITELSTASYSPNVSPLVGYVSSNDNDYLRAQYFLSANRDTPLPDWAIDPPDAQGRTHYTYRTSKYQLIGLDNLLSKVKWNNSYLSDVISDDIDSYRDQTYTGGGLFLQHPSRRTSYPLLQLFTTRDIISSEKNILDNINYNTYGGYITYTLSGDVAPVQECWINVFRMPLCVKGPISFS